MKSNLVAFLAVCMTALPSFAWNINSDNRFESKFIKVMSVNDRVSFEYCEEDLSSCIQIGKQKSYSVSDLQMKRKVELAKAGGKSLLLVGGGLIGGVLAVNATGVAAGAVLAGGAAVGTAITTGAVVMFDKTNPMNNIRNRNKLSDDVILGRPVQTTSVATFARALEKALDN